MEGITGLSRGAAGGDGCKEVGPALDSTGQKVEQAHHLQQTEEESEEEKSSEVRRTKYHAWVGVCLQRSKTGSFL